MVVCRSMGRVSVFVNVELAVDLTHLPGVVEDQRDEHVDRALMGEPEAERVAAELDVVEQVGEQDAGAERDQEPDDQDLGQQSERRLPVPLGVMLHCAVSSRWKESRDTGVCRAGADYRGPL